MHLFVLNTFIICCALSTRKQITAKIEYVFYDCVK